MDTNAEGIIAEHQAAVFLEERGYKILGKNINYPKIGELDIVAMDGQTLVIVEVKYRSTKGYGHPLEAVTIPKVKKIIKATERYIAENKMYDMDIRFDIVSVLDGDIEHLPNAFYGNWH